MIRKPKWKSGVGLIKAKSFSSFVKGIISNSGRRYSLVQIWWSSNSGTDRLILSHGDLNKIEYPPNLVFSDRFRAYKAAKVLCGH